MVSEFERETRRQVADLRSHEMQLVQAFGGHDVAQYSSLIKAMRTQIATLLTQMQTMQQEIVTLQTAVQALQPTPPPANP